MRVLLLIAASRSGVTETMIQKITNGMHHLFLLSLISLRSAPQLHISLLMSAIKQMLVVNRGKLNFGHQYLHRAVLDQYQIYTLNKFSATFKKILARNVL